MRVNLEGARINGAEMFGTKHFAKLQTLAAALQLTDNDPDYLAIDPGGSARNVDLPEATAANNGRTFLIYNSADAAETITVRVYGGGTTVGTVAQAKAAIVANIGGTWRMLSGA